MNRKEQRKFKKKKERAKEARNKTLQIREEWRAKKETFGGEEQPKQEPYVNPAVDPKREGEILKQLAHNLDIIKAIEEEKDNEKIAIAENLDL